MKMPIVVWGLLIAILSTAATAQQKPVPGLGIKLGDDMKTVKQALGITFEPEPMPSSPQIANFPDPNKGKTQYHLRTKGIMVFFTATGRVETIRLEMPFMKPVGGVSIGDSLGKVLSTHGTPFRPPRQFLRARVYVYALDDHAYVAYHIEDDEVQIIFIRR
jgi:hypothetical protein